VSYDHFRNSSKATGVCSYPLYNCDSCWKVDGQDEEIFDNLSPPFQLFVESLMELNHRGNWLKEGIFIYFFCIYILTSVNLILAQSNLNGESICICIIISCYFFILFLWLNNIFSRHDYGIMMI